MQSYLLHLSLLRIYTGNTVCIRVIGMAKVFVGSVPISVAYAVRVERM
jgi:hypothetical protein